jgi:hypothetical protein
MVLVSVNFPMFGQTVVVSVNFPRCGRCCDRARDVSLNDFHVGELLEVRPLLRSCSCVSLKVLVSVNFLRCTAVWANGSRVGELPEVRPLLRSCSGDLLGAAAVALVLGRFAERFLMSVDLLGAAAVALVLGRFAKRFSCRRTP